MNCKECIHFEVCAYVSHYLQACDSYEEPAKHGKWIENYGAPNVKRCSVCKAERHAKESWWSYCPKCGSKMDGKAGEQE